jgi:hypothetical protein
VTYGGHGRIVAKALSGDSSIRRLSGWDGHVGIAQVPSGDSSLSRLSGWDGHVGIAQVPSCDSSISRSSGWDGHVGIAQVPSCDSSIRRLSGWDGHLDVGAETVTIPNSARRLSGRYVHMDVGADASRKCASAGSLLQDVGNRPFLRITWIFVAEDGIAPMPRLLSNELLRDIVIVQAGRRCGPHGVVCVLTDKPGIVHEYLYDFTQLVVTSRRLLEPNSPLWCW